MFPLGIVKSVSSFFAGNWLWLLLAVFVFGSGAALGYRLGYSQGYSEVQALQIQFLQYKNEVLQAVNEGNQKTSIALDNLRGNLGEILLNLEKSRVESQKASADLKKGLQNANGQSCELSPAILNYISLLNARQGAR